MELLLWRWSTTAQIVSALLIAVFFVVLGRSLRRVEARPWMKAWLANLGALGVVVVFWYAQPNDTVYLLLRFGYFFLKTLFVVLLTSGAFRIVRGVSMRGLSALSLAAITLFAVVAAFVCSSNDRIGVAQQFTTSAVLAVGAFVLLRHPGRGAGWLATGFTLRSVMAMVEAAAHLTRIVPNGFSESKSIGIFLAAYSSFDTGIEWMIALGCVLALNRTIQDELARSNSDLIAAKSVLQELVDRDPLTGLLNRRALPQLISHGDQGATLLFFDLNDFKGINDSFGHQFGDLCLKRFAAALKNGFRSDDRIVRYAGDEFVVVVSGDLTPADIDARVAAVRESLRFDTAVGPEIRFSVGSASLAPGDDADEALRRADEAMYVDKSVRRAPLRVI
jgi:diguanylate cyclase (GGDEF)-like protein